jgi:hypothetical protein
MAPRKDVTTEGAYFPKNLGQLVRLRRRIIDAGHPASVANSLVGWLAAKGAGERDTSSPSARARYRRILADLDAADQPPRVQVA